MLLTLPSHDNCDDPVRPTLCTLATGTTFTISVDLLNPPLDGYYWVQTWLDYENQGPSTQKNTQATWADRGGPFLTINDVANNGAQATCTTSALPPLTASFYSGSIYTFEFTCTVSPSTSIFKLIPGGVSPAGTSGTTMHEMDGSHTILKFGDLTIECLDLPGDTDGDGCSDGKEFGNDETKGGRRDYKNPWDFYDVAGAAGGPPDGIVDLANDIFGVIQHFSPQGTEQEYDVQFDRGLRTPGKDVWNLTAPDGVIDLAHDILGVIWQFNHDCR